MVSLIKRAFIQVGSENANEETLSLSSTTNKGHYISLRPYIKREGKEFPYEWAFAGRSGTLEVSKIDATSEKQNYTFELDTNVQMAVPDTHRGVIKTVWTTWDNGSIEERGSLFPWGPEGSAVDFRELWQPIDPLRTEFVQLDSVSDVDPKAKSFAAYVDDDEFQGMVIVVGKWAQGLLLKKGDSSTKSISIMRAIVKDNKAHVLIEQFGSDFDKFPEYFAVKEGEKIIAGGVEWDVIESNY